MRVAIVENTKDSHHGQIGVALHEAAAKIDLYKPWADNVLPIMGSYDGLVVLGGPQNARADDTHPYLAALADQMFAAAMTGKAVMGVCLGAQIMARGAGAENLIGVTPEMGWHKVNLTEAGRSDPVLGHVADSFDIFQWHSDTFSLPETAVQLACSPIAPVQGYRIGRAGYATQFHFEANTRVVADWAASSPLLMEQEFPGFINVLPERAACEGARADANGLAIARAWVALI